MVCYTASKPPSVVNPEWIFWSKNDYGQSIVPKQVSSLLFITRKKEICVIYKPTPVFNDGNKLTAIIGNMFDESSSLALFRINKDEISSCYAIREFNLVPTEFCPQITLQADSVKDTDWEFTSTEILLVAIPTQVPLPYNKEIKSTTRDDEFDGEMQGISNEHGFWAKTVHDIIKQAKLDNHTDTVFKRMTNSAAISSSRDPACAATKGFRTMTFASNPLVNVSLLGKNIFKAAQETMKEFFCRNPTPAHVEDLDDEEETEEVQIPVISAIANQAPPAAPALASITNPPADFFAQLIETIKNIQAPQHPAKIVVESRDHEDSVDLAKLQNRMLQLMYAMGEIIWDDGIVKNICVASFSQGFLNLLTRSASVQATQLSNLFMTIFLTKPKEDGDNSQISPLNRLMSLVVFRPKFTKGHLNTSIQSSDPKAGSIYKSTSINPFQYALQNNRKLIMEAAIKMDEEHNKIN
jgi:hypothetical protein